MEWLIDLAVGQGLSRDVAVNLVTDLLMTLVFGFLVAGLTNWFRDRSEASKSKTLFAGANRTADQCIINYLAAGRALVRAGRSEQPSYRAGQLAKFEKRLQAVREIAQEYQSMFARLGPGLAGGAFSDASDVSEGLSILARHAEEMKGWRPDLAARLAAGDLSEEVLHRRFDFWLNFLEEAAAPLQSRANLFWKKRANGRRNGLAWPNMRTPTGQVDLVGFERRDLKMISRAMWAEKNAQRAQIWKVLAERL